MESTGDISTEELLRMLFREHSLERFLNRDETLFAVPEFHDYITSLCKQRKVIPERVINAGNIEKSYGHQLFSGKRNPSRDTVIQLAFGFGMNIEETQTLLKIARKSPLYPRVKRDSAIIYCLHHQMTVVETQIVLCELGLPELGGGRHERDKGNS